MSPSVDRSKLREAILYVALRSEGDPNFGKTKLFKVLFYGDFGYYAQTGRAITGATYERMPYGPVPREAFDLIDEMVVLRELALAPRHHFGFEQQCPLSLREPDLQAAGFNRGGGGLSRADPRRPAAAAALRHGVEGGGVVRDVTRLPP